MADPDVTIALLIDHSRIGRIRIKVSVRVLWSTIFALVSILGEGTPRCLNQNHGNVHCDDNLCRDRNRERRAKTRQLLRLLLESKQVTLEQKDMALLKA